MLASTTTLALALLAVPGLPGPDFPAHWDPATWDPATWDPATWDPAPDEDPTELVESITFEIERDDGTIISVDRGILRVPNVRGRAGLPEVRVEFHLFPCEDESSTAPPIFLLQGGPGFEGLRREVRTRGFYDQQIHGLARLADVVVVGQRGIGTSTPDTRCGGYEREALHERHDEADFAKRVATAATACRATWEGEGYDLSGFSVVEAAADVIDVADLLGYESITLVGNSFGSHWGMTIMRFHADRVVRAVLSGLEGPNHTYDMPTYVLHSLERIAAAAEADANLAPHVPEGGLLRAFEAAAVRLDETPVLVELGSFEVLMDGARLRQAALGTSGRTSSRRGIRTWPADMIRIASGDLEGAARRAMQRNMGAGLPTASFFCLDCGSGISEERLAQLENDPAASIVGPGEPFYRAACAAWERDLGEDFRRNFETKIPTILIHGTWDTSTPFDNALELAPYFLESRLVIVEGGSHGAAREALDHSAEFRAAMDRFLVAGEMDDLPETVELPPLDWAELAPPGDGD